MNKNLTICEGYQPSNHCTPYPATDSGRYMSEQIIPIHDGSGNCTTPKMMHRCPCVCTAYFCDCKEGECKISPSYLKAKKEDMQLTTLAAMKHELEKSMTYYKEKVQDFPEFRYVIIVLEGEIRRIEKWMPHEANMVKKAFIDGQIDANKQQLAIAIPKMADDYFAHNFTQKEQGNETI